MPCVFNPLKSTASKLPASRCTSSIPAKTPPFSATKAQPSNQPTRRLEQIDAKDTKSHDSGCCSGGGGGGGGGGGASVQEEGEERRKLDDAGCSSSDLSDAR